MVTLGNAALRAQKTSTKTIEDGAPERIRTSDPQIRSLVLYPAELRARRMRVLQAEPANRLQMRSGRPRASRKRAIATGSGLAWQGLLPRRTHFTYRPAWASGILWQFWSACGHLVAAGARRVRRGCARRAASPVRPDGREWRCGTSPRWCRPPDGCRRHGPAPARRR